MKKLMTIMLGLSLLGGTVAAIAQTEAPAKTEKKAKKTGEKKTKTPKKAKKTEAAK